MGCFSNGPDDVGRWQRATFKFFFFFFIFRGPLLDWFGQIMLYSHWLTQTWCSTHAYVLATDEAVGIEQNFGMSVDTAVVAMTYFKHLTAWAL